MKWIEIQVKTTTEASEIVTNLLYESGAEGLVIEDPNIIFELEKKPGDYIDGDVNNYDFEGILIKAYIQKSNDLVDKIDLLKQNIKNISNYDIDYGPGEVLISEVEDSDWAEEWKKYYKPKRIGEKIVIKPTWEEFNAKDGDIVVNIDPGMSFGTGTHETTMMCIEQLEKYVHQYDTVIDVGCGTGVLAMVAAKLGAINTLAIDLDEDAVGIAKENIELNGLKNRINVKHGNLLDMVDLNANVIVGNLLAEIVVILSSEIRKFLEDDGVFISSGIILDKIDIVVEALESNGLDIVNIQKMGEWACIVSKPTGV